jgi:hypothetical protein
MKRLLFLVLLLALLFGSSLPALAQTEDPLGELEDPLEEEGDETGAAENGTPTDTVFTVSKKPPRTQKKLVLLGTTDEGELISVNYESPYTGMAEFSLYGPDGKRVYFNQYPSKIGSCTIRLKRVAFKTPGTYTYVIRYKDQDYKGKLEIGG